jgi:hypothetical protein
MAQRVGERRVDASLAGQMIEGQRLVEAAHLDRPFDRLAVAPERERAVRCARDRHHPAIDFRREGPIDRDLGLASCLALRQCGEIQKWKAHRALDLEGALAGEKDRSRVGIDALDRLSAMGRRVTEQRQDRLLRVDLGIHGLRTLPACHLRHCHLRHSRPSGQ